MGQGPIDVLMLQLGTPADATTKAVRPYLRQFLKDPRVIEAPAAVRWLLVEGIIAPFRSPTSAGKYARIWDANEGSPLLTITRRQRDALQARLGERYRVHFGMRYGEPSIGKVVRELAAAKCQRLIVVPMFPQYSATTTASGLDALFDAWKRERVLPAMRIIDSYHDDPAYLDACVAGLQRGIDAATQAGHPPEICLISFHGIPISYVKRGDPYQKQACITGKAIAKRMGWAKQDWRLVFQSRLGKQKWLLPYTDETLVELGKAGVKTVLVTQPGFTADCLETIDEIGYEGLEEFREAGGENLVRVPCSNDDPAFIAALQGIVEREACGWVRG